MNNVAPPGPPHFRAQFIKLLDLYYRFGCSQLREDLLNQHYNTTKLFLRRTLQGSSFMATGGFYAGISKRIEA